MPEQIDPAMWLRPELQPVLIGHDIGALYRALHEAGVAQRRIAALTGTTQSQVADIMTGRRARVVAYDVLVRNAEGLGIPRERMGLSFWGPDGGWYGPAETYPGGTTLANTPKGVSTQMLRRHLIAYGGMILAGVRVEKVGELLPELGELPAVVLPSRLGPAHVAQVRDVTRQLGVGDAYRPYPVLDDAAAWATQLLTVPGPDAVVQALQVAVAELHIEAGWAGFDAGLYHPALYHFARAVELGRQAGDAYCQAIALGYAGLASIEHGHPNDGLKMKQAAQVAAWAIPSDDQRAVVVGESGRAAVEACQLVSSARALALLGEHSQAATAIAKGRDIWTPTPADPFGDPDRGAARLELERGRLDVAEALAGASLRRWAGGRQLSRTQTGIVQATIYVTAGEQRGLLLAHTAITDAAKLTSVRARKTLVPLAKSLESRPGSDAQDLARMARLVAA